MIKIHWGLAAVILTMILSSFINYENPLGMAFKLTQFQILSALAGVAVLFLSKEKSTPKQSTPAC